MNNPSGKLLNEVWGTHAAHALYRENGTWYHQLTKFPGVLFDSNGYIVFSSEDEYLNCPNLQIGKELGIPGGISQIPGYIKLTENNQIMDFSYELSKKQKSSDLVLVDSSVKYESSENESERTTLQVTRTIRDSALSKRVKILYDNKCQLCGTTIELRKGELSYAEGHHIKPIGNPHRGPDVLENLLCVCPNCHVKLDYGAIRLEKEKIASHPRHMIKDEYMGYHNQYIYLAKRKI